MEALISRIRLILGKDSSVQVEDLTEEIERTQRNIRVKTFGYKWFAFLVLTAIPIISTVVSALVAEGNPSYRDAIKYLSYSLTLLAVLNSIFRPGERFMEICRLGLRIERLRDYFTNSIEKLGREAAPAKMRELCHKIEKALVPIEYRLITLFLPDVQSSVADARAQEELSGVPATQPELKPAAKSAKAR